MVGSFTGSAKIRRGSSLFDSSILVSMEMPVKKSGRDSDQRKRLRLASDGKVIQVLDEGEKTLRYGKISKAAHLFYYAYYTVWTQSVSAAPFQAELQSKTIDLVGTDSINGVLCNVIYVINPFGGKAWWYLGKNDFLPRAQKLVNDQPNMEASFTFEISELKTEQVFTPKAFQLQATQGFTLIDEDERIIKAGATAPELILRTAEGNPVALPALRGKTVILDFWASWCPPCWTLMPKINRLSQEFAESPVEFIGINTWESPAVNPREYMSKKSFSYRLLFDHDGSAALAYKLLTLPGLFVIDAKGKLAYVHVGDKPELEEELRKVIKATLSTNTEAGN